MQEWHKHDYNSVQLEHSNCILHSMSPFIFFYCSVYVDQHILGQVRSDPSSRTQIAFCQWILNFLFGYISCLLIPQILLHLSHKPKICAFCSAPVSHSNDHIQIVKFQKINRKCKIVNRWYFEIKESLNQYQFSHEQVDGKLEKLFIALFCFGKVLLFSLWRIKILTVIFIIL